MIFPDKIPYLYNKSWNNTVYGYMTESSMEEAGKINYVNGYIDNNKLMLPAKFSTEHINFSMGSTTEETLRWIYNYAQRCNEIAVPIYMVTDKEKKLTGAVFPCYYMQPRTVSVGVHGYAKLTDRGCYVEIYKNQFFPNIPITNLGPYVDMHQDYYSGVLYVNGKPVLSSYLQNETRSVGWFFRTLASNLVEAYACYYAQNLLKDDEVLLVEFKKNEKKFMLSGVSVGSLKIRNIGYCTPVLESIRILRQPFIILGTEEVITNIPQGNDDISIEGGMETYTLKRWEKVEDNLEECIFQMAEAIDKKKFSVSEAPYAQILGYNNVVKFPDANFAENLLRNL